MNRIVAQRFLVCVIVALISSFAEAATFNIVPQRTLPPTVPQHGAAFAYYVISNLTTRTLSNNFVKNLPAQVTQVTCQPQFCGTTFDLAPMGSDNDSCILKLIIKGPTPYANPFEICTVAKTDCDETTYPLNVTQVDSLPFIGVGAGGYSNSARKGFPFLATTNDSGANWHYPPEVFKALTSSIDPSYTSGSFFSAACSGENDKSICIASGQYSNNVTTFPLIAVGLNNATTWNYPRSVFEHLQSAISPDFVSGKLRGASCSGSGKNSTCIAAGDYMTQITQLPLLAKSSDGGLLWTYPESVHQNLKSVIAPDFLNGFLESASCSKSTCQTVCIASGGYCNSSKCFPLLALSKDKGNNWIYPSDIFNDLTTKIDSDFGGGSFESSSCTGSGNETICAAAGTFFTSAASLPLVAVTQNGGNTWSYPPSIFSDLPTRIGHRFTGGIFNSTSCTGSGRATVCLAVGTFFRDGPNFPFIAVSRDAGSTWNYPDFIYTKLKKLVDPKFTSGNFLGASCTGKGKHAICVAAGTYCQSVGCSNGNPLIAVSKNGGKSWTYPPSVFSDLTTKIDPNYQLGLFRDVSCTGNENYNICIATGQYSNDIATFPLVAVSRDSGQTWTYPTAVFRDLNIKIDPDFIAGIFNSAGTTGGQFPGLSMIDKVTVY